MKTRNGFVSNSSSSSFIVIDNRGQMTLPGTLSGVYQIGADGHTDFGWEQTRYTDIHSKINFAYLQTKYVNLDTSIEWLKMLNNVLKKHGASVVNPMYRDGYIDHQSAASEGANMEMFNTEEDLEAFIFGEGSYIQGDNDNH